MSDHQFFKFSNWVLIAPFIAVLSIWTVFWIELLLQTNFNEFGIYPGTLKGLRGIVFAPFIHGSVEHLYNNTVPLAFLITSLFYFYRGIAVKVLFWGVLIAGMITWVIGRPSYHIGASSVIYLLASFVFFKGIFTRHFRLVALSLIVVFLYGGLLWYIFPVKGGISWEGHLGGFLSGLLLAAIFKTKVPLVKKFDWEHDDYNEGDDEFLKQFDEHGNFIENKGREPTDNSVHITYHYKKNDKDAND